MWPISTWGTTAALSPPNLILQTPQTPTAITLLPSFLALDVCMMCSIIPFNVGDRWRTRVPLYFCTSYPLSHVRYQWMDIWTWVWMEVSLYLV